MNDFIVCLLVSWVMNTQYTKKNGEFIFLNFKGICGARCWNIASLTKHVTFISKCTKTNFKTNTLCHYKIYAIKSMRCIFLNCLQSTLFRKMNEIISNQRNQKEPLMSVEFNSNNLSLPVFSHFIFN